MMRWALLAAGAATTTGSAAGMHIGSLHCTGGTSMQMGAVVVVTGMFLLLIGAVVVSMVLALCAAHGSSKRLSGTESDSCTDLDHEIKAPDHPTSTPELQKHHGNSDNNTTTATTTSNNNVNRSSAAVLVSNCTTTLNASLTKMNSLRKSSFPRNMDCKHVDVVELQQHRVRDHKFKSTRLDHQQLTHEEESSAAKVDSNGSNRAGSATPIAAGAAPPPPAAATAATAPPATGPAHVWQRTILRGNRCAPLAFSGLILYDEQGRPLAGNKQQVHKS
ncbi:hypothetical protein CY35_16G081500 [Sphagnum magellanicum]|nr:hypothetical protein CY35_16G081500 [Sphagnum magellanicum]